MDTTNLFDSAKALNPATTDPWRTVRNPMIDDEVTFLRTASETNGAYAFVRVTLAPGGGNDLHFHTTFAEEFEAVEGELTIECAGQTVTLRPGERAVAPIGSRHLFANRSDRPTTFLALIRPAQRFEETIRVVYGLARDGKVNTKGLPKNPLHLGLIFAMGDTYPASLPLWLQRVLFGPITVLARWRKADRDFAPYLNQQHGAPTPHGALTEPTA